MSAALYDRLKTVTTGTITTMLLKKGIRRCWMQGPMPLEGSGRRIIGPAFTMRFIPVREDLATPESWAKPISTRGAIEAMPEGCIAVADAMGVTTAGIFGDILTMRMMKRNVAALVTDGVIRDKAGVLASKLPTWCAGVAAPASVNGLTFVGWDEPIACGGCAIFPGDIIVCDDDGAVVIPQNLLAFVADGGRRARADGDLHRQRGREGRKIARSLSDERGDQGALRGLEEEPLTRASAGSRCSTTPQRSSASSRSRPISSSCSASSARCCCARGFRAAGWRLAIGSLVLLAVIGLSPVGNALIVPLEQRFPPWDHSRGAPHGIVVLGGALSPDVSHARNTVALNEAAERLTAVAELARRYPDARIIFSGGSGAVIFDERPEAEFALRLLESLGVAKGRVVAEDKSRNTVENARFSRELAQPKPGERWLLVTSAYHLPRADRHLPQGRLPGRGLSGRLAHPRHRRRAAAVSDHGRGPAADRHRHARMDRARGLLGDRADVGAVSRPDPARRVRPRRRRWPR